MVLRFQILLPFAILINSGLCLNCIRCSSNDIADCAEVKQCFGSSPQYMNDRIKNIYFPDSKVIYDDSNVPQSVCYTSVITENGQKKTNRDCSAVGSKLTCEILQIDAKNANFDLDQCFTCDNDLCNSSTILIHSSLMLIIPSLFLKYW